jgi:predicted Zn-dependent protease
VIRVVTLDELDPADLASVTRSLYRAFGLGTEAVGLLPMPDGLVGSDGGVDALALLRGAPAVRTFADDKVLYVASAPLSLPEGPLGEPPCWGFADYGKDRALVSTARLPQRGVTEGSVEAFQRRLAREAVHAMGHLWDLHHCVDSRCAMHPSWSPHLPASPEMDLCAFCRDKSERKIRLAKT